MSINEAHDFFIQWHLTEKCNLRCKHCYQEGQKMEEMSFADVKSIVGEVSHMISSWEEAYSIKFSRSFNVTGGEPFLRHDIFYILEEMGSYGFDLYLLSNGTLITNEISRALAALGVKGVQVSIEGPESVHDEIRGRGSFSSSLNGIASLLGAGVQVSLNTTLSKTNAGYFMQMVDLASSLGVHKLGFARLVPSGRGSGMLDKMLTSVEIKELYERVASLKTPSIDIVTGDPIASQLSPLSENDNAGSVALSGCAAGVSGLTILPDGTITPCRRLNIPLGNARKDAIREIWATSPVLEAIRDRSKYGGRCGTCRKWALCRGCRAIAFAYSKSTGENTFLAEDPQCFIDRG